MGARREVVAAVAERYRLASRVEKRRLLEELCSVTGWHRKHAVRKLASNKCQIYMNLLMVAMLAVLLFGLFILLRRTLTAQPTVLPMRWTTLNQHGFRQLRLAGGLVALMQCFGWIYLIISRSRTHALLDHKLLERAQL